MSCETCGDKGITRLNWSDHAEEYSVCLCPAGLELRKAENSGKTCVPLWVLWAHQRGIAVDRVWLVEDVLTPEELAVRGLTAGPQSSYDREAALLAATRRKR